MMLKKHHRYNLIWDKELPTGFLNANVQPLRSHEDIMIFYQKKPTYNPQMTQGAPNHNSKSGIKKSKYTNNNYGECETNKYNNDLGDKKYPKSILKFQKPHPSVTVHPTQKPVDLMEYLINTYSNEGETILDFTMGSGTTGVACKNSNRSFIGIELEKKYFEIAKERIENSNYQIKLF